MENSGKRPVNRLSPKQRLVQHRRINNIQQMKDKILLFQCSDYFSAKLIIFNVLLSIHSYVHIECIQLNSEVVNKYRYFATTNSLALDVSDGLKNLYSI